MLRGANNIRRMKWIMETWCIAAKRKGEMLKLLYGRFRSTAAPLYRIASKTPYKHRLCDLAMVYSFLLSLSLNELLLLLRCIILLIIQFSSSQCTTYSSRVRRHRFRARFRSAATLSRRPFSALNGIEAMEVETEKTIKQLHNVRLVPRATCSI